MTHRGHKTDMPRAHRFAGFWGVASRWAKREFWSRQRREQKHALAVEAMERELMFTHAMERYDMGDPWQAGTGIEGGVGWDFTDGHK